MSEPDRVRLNRVLAELASAVAADRGAALYLDDGDGALSLVASTTQVAGAARWQRVLRREGGGRVLIVPVPDASGGVLVLERSRNVDFTREDRALAALYARQLTDQVSARSTFRQSLWTRQLEAVQRIAGQLTRLASIEEVGAAMCRETRQVIDYDEALVMVVGEDGVPREVASARGAEGDRALPVGQETPLAQAIRRAVAGGAPLLVPDAPEPSPNRRGRWSMVIVPLRYERRVTGVICLLKQGVGRFDDDDVRLLQTLSDQAAVAVENAKLLADQQELVRELNGLLEVTTAASSATDEAALAATLASKMRAASRMDACVLSRWEEEVTLRTLASAGLNVPPATELADKPQRRQVLRDGRPRIVHADTAVTERSDEPAALGLAGADAEARALARLGAETVVLLPLVAAGRPIGLVELYSRQVGRTIGDAEMHAYLSMAGSVAAGLENARLVEQLRLAADIDQLTGVNNHRYLQDRLRQEAARAARSRSPLCVLLLDLDHFKPINDRHGHAEGDRVLRSVAAVIRSQVRTNDIVARYGGDEFVVVMPDTSEGRAEEVARRVVAGIQARRHDLRSGEQVSVGASAGLAVYPDDGRTAAALLQAADSRMYQAKRASRGNTSRSPIEHMEPALSPTPG